jgi:hypothetical protein
MFSGNMDNSNIPVQIPAYKQQVSVQHRLLGWLLL